MAITTLNLRALNRSYTASSGQVVTATSATAMDFQAAGGDISFGLHPLTKDGGATLNIRNSLFSLFGYTNKSSMLRDWDDLLN